MKKLFLAIVVACIAALCASAQNYEDVVYLMNGSVIRGTIVEQVPYQTLKIQTRDGSLFVYSFDEVEKIAREEAFDKGYRAGRSRTFNKQKGYFGLVEMQIPTILLGAGTLGIDMINGYRVCPQFAAGVGVGLETFCFINIQVPVYLHLRTDLLNRRVSPYIALNAGYNIGSSSNFFGLGEVLNTKGVFFRPQIGISYNIGDYRMTTGFDFKVHSVASDGDRFWLPGLFGINVGFSF